MRRKRKIRIHPRVNSALLDIDNYLLKTESKSRRNKIIDSIISEFLIVADNPYKNPQVVLNRFFDRDFRKGLIHKNYIFLYEILEDEIEILFLIHGSRNPKIISSFLKK